MTLPADVQQIDQTGYVWTFLDAAAEPDRVTVGALIVAGDAGEPFLARVVNIVDGPKDRSFFLTWLVFRAGPLMSYVTPTCSRSLYGGSLVYSGMLARREARIAVGTSLVVSTSLAEPVREGIVVVERQQEDVPGSWLQASLHVRAEDRTSEFIQKLADHHQEAGWELKGSTRRIARLGSGNWGFEDHRIRDTGTAPCHHRSVQ